MPNQSKARQKPKCGPGATACGMSCVSGKYSCRDVLGKAETSYMLSIFGISFNGRKSVNLGNYKAADNVDLESKGLAAFDNASTRIKSLIEALPKPKYITENKDDKAGVSAFNLRIDGKSAIYMGANIDMESPSGRMTYRHEYGHHLDGEMGNMSGKFFSQSRSFKYALEEDAAQVLEDERSPGKGNWELLGAINKSQDYSLPPETILKWSKDTETLAIVAGTLLGEDGIALDTVGCLTKNKIGSGHTNEYLSNPDKGAMEVFANLFALHTDGSELAKAVANRFAPRAYKEMLKALGEQE